MLTSSALLGMWVAYSLLDFQTSQSKHWLCSLSNFVTVASPTHTICVL